MPAKPPSRTIRSDERVFICGRTGTGKTYLARHLLKNFSRLVVLDSKGTLSNWGLNEYTSESRQALRRGEAVRVRIVADPLRYPEETWAEAMLDLYESGNAVLYIDEVYAVVDQGTRPPPVMTAIWTRGRELGIGAWAATQAPVWVPLVVMREAEHFFSFRLNLFEDRQRVAKFTSEEVIEPINDPHGFYYFHVGDEKPIYQPTLYLNGGEPKESSNGVRSKT